MAKENKPKTLERKLKIPLELQFSEANEVVGKHGLKWTEFPVTLKARGTGHINHWWFGRVIHDLSGMSVPSGGTIPIDHVHTDEALGVIDEFDTKDGLTLKGKFVSTQIGDTAWNLATKMEAGIPYQASIFFDDLEDGTPIYEQILKKDQSDTVNGQKFEGPGIIVRKWLLRGVATCLYGADPNTKTQVLKHQQPYEETMDPKEQLKQFTEKFGAELANKYFSDGLDMEQAISKFSDVLQDRLKAADKLAAEKDTKIAELEKQFGEANGKVTELAAKTEKVAELEKQLGETKTKLEVMEKQYGGISYDELAKKNDGTTPGTASNPENEYAAELKQANTASGNAV
jgi:hypothetical protein